MTPGAEDFIESETDADEMCNFEIDLIPGLLQVEEYTRALVPAFSPGTDEDLVTKRVQLRMARQQRLLDGSLRLWAVIGTPALDCPVGGVDVQRKQLQRLLHTAEHPNVTLQVLPYGFGEHIAMGMPFSLAQYADGGGAAVLDLLSGILCLEDQADLNRYSLAFRHLCAAALPARDSMALVRRKYEER